MNLTRTFPIYLSLFLSLACGSANHGDDALLDKPPYAVWTDSIRQFPDRSLYYFERGKLFNQNNDSAHAVSDLKRAVSISAQPDYVVLLSSFWLGHGQPDTARALLVPAIRRNPYNQLLQRNLLMSYFDQGAYDQALKVNNEALGYDSTSSGNWYNRAMVMDALKDSGTSLRCLERAYLLDSGNAIIAYDLANRYADAHNPLALSLCDRIIRREALTQKKPDPYTIKGIYYAGVGKADEALSCFNESIATDYTFLEAYLEKGILLFKQKKFKEAQKVFALSTDVDNTFADGYYWTGRCQEQLQEIKDARLNYERAIAFDQHFAEAREALARVGKE